MSHRQSLVHSRNSDMDMSKSSSTAVECEGGVCRLVASEGNPPGAAAVNPWSPGTQLVVAGAMGVAFGIAMEKARGEGRAVLAPTQPRCADRRRCA